MKTIKNLTAEQLRKSILQLAIQGKLVKQDPNDEPASELVKRIREERHRLIQEGKIKKDKNESYIFKGDDNRYYEKVGKETRDINDELPFEIPDNWAWIRLSSLANFRIGKTPVRNDPTQWNEPVIPWVSIADMKDMQTIHATSERISIAGFQKNFGSTIVPKGTLLMSFKLTIGKVSRLGFDAVHNEAIISIFPYLNDCHIIEDYLFHFLGLISKVSDKTNAIKGATLNKDKLSRLLIPLPPLEEEKRILEKLQEVEPYLKQYALAESRLTYFEEHLENRLKASILQYAIEGKLVKQDPNDEPASVLLERIKAEKDKLIKEGKIRPDKHNSEAVSSDDKEGLKKSILQYAMEGKLVEQRPEEGTGEELFNQIQKETKSPASNSKSNKSPNSFNIQSDEIPFDIPTSWKWVKSSWILSNIQYGYNGSGIDKGTYRFLRITDIQNGKVNWSSIPFTNIASEEAENYQVKKNDIFIARTGGTIGKSFLLREEKENAIFAGYLIRFQCKDIRIAPYLSWFLNSPFYWRQVEDKKAGTGQPNINGKSLANLLIPLPPLAEQKRIVATIKTIFAVLDGN